jgi:hypothetical protein
MEQVLHSYWQLRKEGRIMNLFNTGKYLATAAVVVAALSAVGAIAEETYGRAGGAVGAERIQQLSSVHTVRAGQSVNLANWYGRAGGPIGVDRTVGVTQPKAYAAVQTTRTPVVFGRAGVALPFGG